MIAPVRNPLRFPAGQVSGTRFRERKTEMADRGEEAWVQLATRIPKTLHRQLKLHCVRADTSLMDFVVEALREKLTRESSRKRTSRSGT